MKEKKWKIKRSKINQTGRKTVNLFVPKWASERVSGKICESRKKSFVFIPTFRGYAVALVGWLARSVVSWAGWLIVLTLDWMFILACLRKRSENLNELLRKTPDSNLKCSKALIISARGHRLHLTPLHHYTTPNHTTSPDDSWGLSQLSSII